MPTFPIGIPYVGPAPIINQPPAASDWGQIVRPIGPFGPVIIEQPSLSTVTAVPLSLVSVTLQAANLKRRGLAIYNGSTQVLFVKIGAGADVTDYSLAICSGGYWEAPFPATTEIVTGVWGYAGTGFARVTELTVP